MENISIKEIHNDQADLYKEFLLTGLINDEEQFRISPEDEIKCGFPTKGLPDSFTLGAYINDELAGIVSFTRDGTDREKLRHKGILFRMYVSGRFRKRGLGKLLIIELLKRVNDVGNIEQVNLTVVAGNQIARLLYESFGFKIYGSETNAIKWKNKYFTEEFMALYLKK